MDIMTTLLKVSDLKGLVYEVPSCVKVIGDGAFWDCTDLESVVLPDLLKEIGTRALEDCVNLERGRLPAGPCEMGDDVWRCEKLK